MSSARGPRSVLGGVGGCSPGDGGPSSGFRGGLRRRAPTRGRGRRVFEPRCERPRAAVDRGLGRVMTRAPAGPQLPGACGRIQDLANGHTAGSFMRRALATLTTATA